MAVSESIGLDDNLLANPPLYWEPTAIDLRLHTFNNYSLSAFFSQQGGSLPK